jgi:GT2 family glycosyltransferase
VESIYQQHAKYDYEIILVDNDSKDDCKEKVLAKYPNVQWLQLDYNAGFARANNAGIAVAKGEYILLLNADTIVLDNAIDKSISLLKKNADGVGCGIQLLNTDGTTQISGAHIIKGGLNTLLPLPYFGRLVRYLGYRFKSTIPSVQNVADKIEVDWIVGAYMLVKKEVLSKSGLLDNDFFMYAEEIDCANKANYIYLKRQRSYTLAAAPAAIITALPRMRTAKISGTKKEGRSLYQTCCASVNSLVCFGF